MKFTMLAVALSFAATVAHAQSTQTWVSGFGNDASACTLSQPCQTLNGALAKTNSGGEISILDPGPYGPVTIGKSVTINSVSAIGTIVAGAGQTAVTVNAGPADVIILRGLSLNGGSVDRAGGAAEGIRFNTGGRLHIESSTIFAFSGEAVNFAPSGASSLFMNNVSVRANNGGVLVAPTDTGTASAALNGVKMEYGLRGLRAQDGSTVTVRNSMSVGNTGRGFSAFSMAASPRPVKLTIENSVAASNTGSGIGSDGALATIRISNVTVADSGQYGLIAAGGAYHFFRQQSDHRQRAGGACAWPDAHRGGPAVRDPVGRGVVIR